MKIYTQEQVIEVFEKYGNMSAINARNILDLSESIELPSDDEIEKASTDKINILNDCFGQYDFTSGQKDGFIEGAYWMRDKIQGGNK